MELNRCVSCDRSVLRRRKHRLTQGFLIDNREHAEFILQEIAPREIAFNGTRALCHPCWQRSNRAVLAQQRENQHLREPQQGHEDLPVQQVQENQEIIEGRGPVQVDTFRLPGYSRASNTARRCIFDNCRNVPAHVLPRYVKLRLLKDHNFFVPELARVCHTHLNNNVWDELLLQGNHDDFIPEHMADMLNIYKWGLEKKNHLDFEDIESMYEDELHYWAGINKIQFNSILQETRCSATVLGIYLSKIRTGEPNSRLAMIFKMSETSIRRHLHIARDSLTVNFVPRHLGLDHMTIEEVIQRNRLIPNGIFGDGNRKAIVICDGTYVYLQKSSNFLFQRRTYSLHKFRNLLKPFILVCSDGYIIDVRGPYAATKSDANILRDIMVNEDEAFHWLFRPGDVFILDRGFRDAVPLMEHNGYEAHIPPTRPRGEQLSTAEANKSRLVTICRWVVEAINGRIKRDFKIFRNTYFNTTMPNMITDFRIAAALINAAQAPYQDGIYAQRFMNIINENNNSDNELANYVVQNNMNRQRVAFNRIDQNNEAFEDFPRLEYEDLILFALGTYHLKLAKSYVHEHLRPNGGIYFIEVYRHPETIQNKILFRGRIQSRHVRSRQYYTYVLINPAVNGRRSIEGAYCSCIHGKRTLGSCAHVLSIIYYLSWARFQDIGNTPAGFLDEVIVDYEAEL